ncbi:CpaF family protein [Micrococcus luteus]|uniref:CpaF family protein n=1 Tax=Micrococcus luteus TaxID=1270 RepID=UPI0020CBBF9A|nr:ATPase, T2SS/T4P/T4SS family [Micrococcus luteus]UTT45216.1 Flp pilus assembly complex ATPase component TadA [Micrococcus luteus]
MRPFVPAAPARPPRGRRRRPALPEGSRRFPWPRTGPAEPERTQVAAPPLAAPAAGPSALAAWQTDPSALDAAVVRRRVAEARASAADGAEPPLAPLIAEALDAPIDDPRVAALVDELDGFGPLAPWVRTPGVTDVLVDGAGAVWTDGDEGLVRRPGRLDPATARALAVRLLHRAGRRLDAAVPLADARVGGVRVHAVLPPVSGGGTLLSLRIPAATTPSLAALADGWPDGALWADALEALVRDRATVLVSGATGAGKTTLLSAALGRVPGDERIVVVEDTAEAAPHHPHVVALQCRAANAEGAGEVGLAELVRHALRMRPDRLVVGECRGAEVADVLTALNTGHQGAWGTLHANAAAEVPARLTAMASLAGWRPETVAAQARAGVDAVLHIARDGHGRHPVELAVPDPRADGFALLPALTWRPRTEATGGRTVEGPGVPALAARLAGRGGR